MPFIKKLEDNEFSYFRPGNKVQIVLKDTEPGETLTGIFDVISVREDEMVIERVVTVAIDVNVVDDEDANWSDPGT